MFGSLPVLLLMAGCTRSEADRYHSAAVSPDYATAYAACDNDDCRVTVIDRFDRYNDCSLLSDASECHFRQAEKIGRRGNPAIGLRICKRAGPWVEKCDEHLLGMLALEGATMEQAAANFDAVEPDLVLKQPHGRFWAMWFRHQVETGHPVSPEACPTQLCRDALKATFGRGRQPQAAKNAD